MAARWGSSSPGGYARLSDRVSTIRANRPPWRDSRSRTPCPASPPFRHPPSARYAASGSNTVPPARCPGSGSEAAVSGDRLCIP